MSESIESPRAFISYSWTNDLHKEWVRTFASDLVKNGVDVVLDQWHLREGDDSARFMERMVEDATINIVFMVCDSTYVSKANKREGGAGTEAQIITSRIYEQAEERKFIALVREFVDGAARLPHYYGTRIFIDISSESKYQEALEQCVRAVYNKPLHVPPKLGSPPSFVRSETDRRIGTDHIGRRVIDLFENGRGNATGALSEYLDRTSNAISIYEPKCPNDDLYTAISKSIDDTIEDRDVFISVVEAVARYDASPENGDRLANFFDSLLVHHHMQGAGAYSEAQFDPVRFITYEWFLYLIAAALRTQATAMIGNILAYPYIMPGDRGRGAVGLAHICPWFPSMESVMKIRTPGKSWISPVGHLIELRRDNTGYTQDEIVQADLVCAVSACGRDEAEQHYGTDWRPYLLPYSERHYGALPAFLRATDTRYAHHLLEALGLRDKDRFISAANTLNDIRYFRNNFGRYNVPELLNTEKFASR